MMALGIRPAAEARGIPYKWVVLVACAFGAAVGVSPVFFNTLPVFTLAIAQSTGWGRATIVSAISVATLTAVLTSPIVGRLIDRFGPRRIIGVNCVLFGLSLAALGFFHQTYRTYFVFAVIIGLFGNATGIWVYLSVLPRWFDHNLGLSLGIASAGLAFGQALTPLLASTLMTTIGWEMAYVALGALAVCVALICVVFLRDGPAVATNPTEAEIRPAGTEEGLTRTEAMRTFAFWRLMATVLLATMAVGGCLLTMVPYLQDHGLSLQLAARIAAVAGLAGMAGRVLTGFVLDRLNACRVAAVTFALAALAIFLLWSSTSVSGYFVVSALLGFTLGAEGDVIAYITRRTFGTRAFGELYGCVWAAFNCGVLVGPLLLGVSFDQFQSYDPALFVLIASALTAALLMAVNSGDPLVSPRGATVVTPENSAVLASDLSKASGL